MEELRLPTLSNEANDPRTNPQRPPHRSAMAAQSVLEAVEKLNAREAAQAALQAAEEQDAPQAAEEQVGIPTSLQRFFSGASYSAAQQNFFIARKNSFDSDVTFRIRNKEFYIILTIDTCFYGSLHELIDGVFQKIVDDYQYKDELDLRNHIHSYISFSECGSARFNMEDFQKSWEEGELEIDVLPAEEFLFIPTGNGKLSEDAPTFNTTQCCYFDGWHYVANDTPVILVFIGPNGTLLFPTSWEEDWDQEDLIENGIIQAKKAINDEDCGTPEDFNPSTCSIMVIYFEATIFCSM